VRRYQEIAFRVAYVITGSASDAEEAAQDGFVKAYFALGRFQTGAPFRPWLLQIVANEARNRRRSATRRFAVALDDIAAANVSEPEDSPEELLLDAERAGQLVDCLNQLAESDRQVLAYRYLLELSEAEMAAALGVARGTVKSRLSRALSRARTTCESRRNDDG
jgi:RNA polymerase sigma-70 factor (ECF subfamily)